MQIGQTLSASATITNNVSKNTSLHIRKRCSPYSVSQCRFVRQLISVKTEKFVLPLDTF